MNGRKTVTRRVVKFPSHVVPQRNGLYTLYADGTCYENQHLEHLTQYIKNTCQVNDILWVRETWGNYGDGTQLMYKADYPDGAIKYIHDDRVHTCNLPKWRPSIHMPKEAARIFLKVKDVRVERLQDITEEQAEREGFVDDVEYCQGNTARGHFAELWDTTIDKKQMDIYGWKANPWVWVFEFERIEQNTEV